MSFKAKNLSYGKFRPMLRAVTFMLIYIPESNEPAFLRKLKSEYGAGVDPARHQHPLARPRKQNATEDADDEPTYVDEDTLDNISKDEYTALLMRDKEKADNDPTSSLLDRGRHSEDGVSGHTGEQLHNAKPAEQLQANIGGTSKKRLIKAIGDHSEVQENIPDRDGPSPRNANRDRTKRKKIKLSFEEEAET